MARYQAHMLVPSISSLSALIVSGPVEQCATRPRLLSYAQFAVLVIYPSLFAASFVDGRRKWEVFGLWEERAFFASLSVIVVRSAEGATFDEVSLSSSEDLME